MGLTPWALFVAIFALGGFSARAECVNDHRSNKNAGILITDFTITGTQTISATDLARITSDMIGFLLRRGLGRDEGAGSGLILRTVDISRSR